MKERVRTYLTYLIVLGLIVVGVGVARGWWAPPHVVAVVDLRGPMVASRTLIESLDRIAQHGRVVAVVLRVDSPGGNVAVAQDVFEAVRRIDEAGKPVVAAIGSTGASGGYYAALAAREIWVQPGSLTGSIGVIYERLDVSGLADKLGVARKALTAGAYKDVGSFWRQPTPQETDMMQAVLADLYQQFLEVVQTRRRLQQPALLAVADGRVWTGRQAVSLGLADQVGSWRAAARRAAELAGHPGDTPVEEWSAGSWLSQLPQPWRSGASGPVTDGLLREWLASSVETALPRWEWLGGAARS